MNLSESDDERLLRESATRFLGQSYDFATRRRLVSESEGWDETLWRQFAELGWLGLPLPQAYGGLGCDAVALGILMEAFGRALVVAPYLSTVVLGAGAIAQLGSEAQRNQYLPAVADGRLRLAFAHGEAGRTFDDVEIQTSASRHGEGWILHGAKSLVLDGGSAHRLLVSAQLGARVGVFIVPPDARGLELDPYSLVDDRRAADLRLDGVRLTGAALLGDGDGDAMPAISMILDCALAALSSDAVGVADALVEATVDYTRTRVQFGKPIGSFQVIQHRIADMAVAREDIRSAALLACLRMSAAPRVRARVASSAKASIGRALRQLAQAAVQLHGAMGVTEELSVGAYFKRATAYEWLLGSSDWHLRRYLAATIQGNVRGNLRDSLLD